MSFQIEQVVLYSLKGELRTVNLRPNKLNIITGQSNRGKSALIQIIEYCLGRSTFMIPEGKIRDSVAWYGLLLVFEDGLRVFVAKPAPVDGAASQSRVFLDKGPDAAVPSFTDLVPNVNDEYLESWFGARLGISPNMHIPDRFSARHSIEASIKHTAFYLYQGQGVVANKDILFHRQTEEFMPQTIRDTLPYFLGAIREDALRLTQELRDAQRRLRLAERQLAELATLATESVARGRALLGEAMQAGILPPGTTGGSQDEVLELLQRTQLWTPQLPLEREGDRTNTARVALDELRARLRQKTEQIESSEAFAREAEGYSTEASKQLWRLQSIDLMKSKVDNKCPLCDSQLPTTIPAIADIHASLSELQAGLAAVTTERPRLRDYIEGLRTERQYLREQIEQRRVELEALMAEQAAWEELKDANARAARVLGRVSLYLETVKLTDSQSRLRSEIERADQEVKRLRRELDDDGLEERETSILRRLSTQMTAWAIELSLEHSPSPYRLEMGRLTVVADRPDRPIPMPRMGGGQNWLGCHLVALLAMHAHFLANKRPVPHFLVLDQPSQVYFASPDVYRSMSGTTAATIAANADMDAVRRMFRFLWAFCETEAPGFQILVLEHANLEDDWFQEALVEEPWADEVALVPDEWPTVASVPP